MLYQRLLRYSLISAAVAASIGLSACGGGGGGTTNVVPTALTGTAAAGAPIIGQVTVKGSLGVSKSALIEADGSYTVDVTGLTAPYRLRAEGTVGGRTYKLHSYAEESDVGGNVNITPFTDLIVANAAQQIAESYFDSATPADLDPVEVDAQEEALQAKLQNVFDALGVSTAIDLLNSTFSADHSGLDAALDIVSVEVDPVTYIATITNLVENTTITDSVVDTTDNADTLTVTDATALTGAVTDTQAIAAIFEGIQAAYASGLPTQASIQDYFSADFYSEDTPIAPWLTDITTDPGMIGTGFSGISVSNLDSVAGTATVTFNFSSNGVMELEPITWYAAKDATLGWQLRGDQRIVETQFSYHCNDGDGDGGFAGACGINTRFWDNDFSNNGTGDVAIASGTVSIIDGSDGTTVKAVVYLGTPAMSSAGDVQVYDEAGQMYTWDWKGFGTALGEIDPSIFAVGDIIEYAAYTEALDISSPSAPAIAVGATPVATYTDNLLFAPATTGKYPTATAATVTAMTNFTLGNDLTVGWTLASGTRIGEILVEISDSAGNRIEIWDWLFGSTATSKTYASTALDSAAATAAGLLSTDATYNLKVRIYAVDELTGQYHSKDYDTAIPGPGAGGVVTPGLTCGYESGWDDLADGGLGAPITPNSFADYETVLADCGTAAPFTAADIAGSAFVEGGLETITFNDTAAVGTFADPETGVYDDGAGFVLDFEWYVEDATCSGCTHSYVVVYSDSTLDADLPSGFWFRETSAVIGVTGTPGVAGSNYSFAKYSEQSNYSDADRATGTDGEIWFSLDNVLQ